MVENKDIKISIIIPVYNAEKYIKQCIESILNQDYKNIEIILIDDGSIDNSLNICKAFEKKDKRVKLFSKENEGAAIARNYGLSKATGDWIIFVDSDDFWNNNSGLKELIFFTNKVDYPIDLIFFNYTRFFQKDVKFIKRPDFPEILLKSKNKIEKLKFLLQNSFIPAPPWGKLIRLKFLKENQIFFQNLRSSEDIPWFMELIEKSENFTFSNIRFHVYRKQVTGALTYSFKPEKYFTLFEIVKKESIRLKSKESKDELSIILLSYLAYQYLILLATSFNFCYNEFIFRQQELKKLKWLLEYDLVKKVKIIKTLNKVLSLNIISIFLHFYAKYIVNRKY